MVTLRANATQDVVFPPKRLSIGNGKSGKEAVSRLSSNPRPAPPTVKRVTHVDTTWKYGQRGRVREKRKGQLICTPRTRDGRKSKVDVEISFTMGNISPTSVEDDSFFSYWRRDEMSAFGEIAPRFKTASRPIYSKTWKSWWWRTRISERVGLQKTWRT